jgi:hypothetical protein
MTVDQIVIGKFCRDIERHLCRKNDGHLIRIVGPAFEKVSGWAARGVPLTIACRGIDRYFERYYARGPRRRPVLIEFCESDVLDAFDEWRRAVGVVQTDKSIQSEIRRGRSLPEHLELVITRLTAAYTGRDRLDTAINAAIGELDAARAASKGLRGVARHALLNRLKELDRMLLDAANADCDSATRARLAAEANAALQPFGERMPVENLTAARRAAVAQLIRDHLRLPIITFE